MPNSFRHKSAENSAKPRGMEESSRENRHNPGAGMLPEIVQTRPTAGGRRAKSNLPGKSVESAVNLSFVQPIPILIHKKVCICSGGEQTVPAFRVGG
jgi:hypothetical protein